MAAVCVWHNEGELTVFGNASIFGNDAYYGGGMYVINDAVHIFEGSRIHSNSARTYGGGIFISHDYGGVMISGNAEITENNAGIHGGGIYLTNGNITVSESAAITGNSAENGGGIYVDSTGVFTQSGGLTTGNAATENGGESYIGWGINISSTANATGNSTHLASSGGQQTTIDVTDALIGNSGANNIILGDYVAGTVIVRLFDNAKSKYENRFHLDLTVPNWVLMFNGATSKPWLELVREWNLTVIGGKGSDGRHQKNTKVPITATIPPGKELVKWIIPSGYKGSIEDSYSVSTIFTISDEDTEVLAYFRDASGGGSGNSDNSFRVLFETFGGTDIPPITGLSYGDRISEPAVPVKDGYVFDGWCQNEAYLIGWIFGEDTIPGDMTLYAKWIFREFTVETPVATSTITPTKLPTAESVTPTRPPTTIIEPQSRDNPSDLPFSESSGSTYLFLGGGILLLLGVFFLLPLLFLRHSVTFLVPTHDGIEEYRIKVWHGRHIDPYDLYDLPELLRNANWYTDEERSRRWDFDEDRVKKSLDLYIGYH